ncbi:MAG: ferric iron uptake transcriptional regulator [Sedimenticola sp.]|uniref:Ferric uptake regulation protein n=1 Tax=Sedimenticola thiotaurini TaxID=1543721 RepID=A0A558CWY0_9GAMM|nr:ferric iron uptake transcriptional regulator [Sedimenticola sp.]TVT53269.1 MAG: ferric iron uptake transcriptional regulator [Sedimenticola thiotaurini]MCW8947124.1 ferric iron uptake transcriptional regulator [Sedimenticola sp.]MCW8948635.1 ferric iron uptake transcriptional regulator [Sedimenticola sp.]MCW8975393.1 ferric iron uptake transcriptional regulator [Sedimenticola sp.]
MEDQEIRNAGLKVTAPRVKILELLENSDERHVSAEDVYKMLLAANEDIGLATVYRVLTQFEEAGLVEKHHFEDGYSVFELNKGKHHDHIVCITCGRVEEFVDETIEQRQQKIADELGFQISEHDLVIYGKCMDDNCDRKG